MQHQDRLQQQREVEGQAAFLARAMRSLANARKSGRYFEAEEVIQLLQAKLAVAKARRPLDKR